MSSNRSRVLSIAVAIIAAVSVLAMDSGALRADADSNQSVTIGVGDTTLLLNGLASPHAFISVREGSATVGTAQADTDGVFSLNLSAQSPGNHQFIISSEDSNNLLSDPASLYISLAEHSHEQADVFLPPTLSVPERVGHGELIRIMGSTVSNATVTINLDGHASQAEADNTGAWVYQQSSDTLSTGTHVVSVYATNTSARMSYSSDLHTITVTDQTIATTVPEPQPSTPAPAATPHPPRITSPIADAQLPAGVTEVRGTSEAGRIIKLYNGPSLLGSTVADEQGNWIIRVSLSSGPYDLSTLACDTNEICSSLSTGIHVVVLPPPTLVTPFAITLDQYAQKVTAGQLVTLHVNSSNPPGDYRLKIIWGDGTIDSKTSNTASTRLRHTYQTAGNYAGTVWAEYNGQVSVVSFSVIVADRSLNLPGVIVVTAAIVTTAVVAAGAVGAAGGPTVLWQGVLRLLKVLLAR